MERLVVFLCSFRFAFLFVFLAGCMQTPIPPSEGDVPSGPRILFMGDSMMAWHSNKGASIADIVAKALGERVENRSVSGAMIVNYRPISSGTGLKISNQYRRGAWDWVVLNGGGNDLWMGCGCKECDLRLDQMLTRDGSWGEIPKMMERLTSGGTRVLYVGYMRSPGVGSMIDRCRGHGDEFENRLARYARSNPRLHFLSIKDLVPYGDRSFHTFDMVHPSPKGSREIGLRVATRIKRLDSSF